MTRALLTLALLAACSSDDRPAQPTVAPRTQRKIPDPPTNLVKKVRPFEIRPDGVGDFHLDDKISSLMPMQPAGERIQRFDISNLVRTGLLRFEADELLVGGEPGGTATFVAVISAGVAETQAGGVHVGSTRADLLKRHGAPFDDPFVARDPRLVVAGNLRPIRAVMDNERIAAFVIAAPVVPVLPPSETPPCVRPTAPAPTFGVCFSPGGEVVDLRGEELTVKSADGERTLATTRVEDAVFAAPLRAVDDRGDDLVIITSTSDDDRRTWSLVAYRLEAGALVRVAEGNPVFTVTSEQTRWINAGLRDLDLYLELTSQIGGIEVGGVITTRKGGRVRDVGMISSALIARGQRKPPVPKPPEP